MYYQRVKQMISKSTFLKVLLSVVLLATIFLYFKAFFTKGVFYENTFLKKEVVSNNTYYTGKSMDGSIRITVEGLVNKNGSADVIYNLPNNINQKYTVNFKIPSNWEFGIENIKDEEGNIVFEGIYRKDSRLLLDKHGRPILGDYQVRILRDGESPFKADYKVSLKNVADFATFSNETIRGKYGFLGVAIFLFALTLIDIKYPLFFFYLRNFLEVKDPEPSDFYLTMQRISWYVYPIIGMILLIVAIT